tara:strand:+ start:4556 stop:4789 length:234 start_codon:yes stop_codon:yes gene_type:complete
MTETKTTSIRIDLDSETNLALKVMATKEGLTKRDLLVSMIKECVKSGLLAKSALLLDTDGVIEQLKAPQPVLPIIIR